MVTTFVCFEGYGNTGNPDEKRVWIDPTKVYRVDDIPNGSTIYMDFGGYSDSINVKEPSFVAVKRITETLKEKEKDDIHRNYGMSEEINPYLGDYWNGPVRYGTPLNNKGCVPSEGTSGD